MDDHRPACQSLVDPAQRLVHGPEHRDLEGPRRDFCAARQRRHLDAGVLEEQVPLLTTGNISIVTANAINRGGSHNGRPIWPVTTEASELGLLDIIEHESSVCVMSIFHRDVPERLGGFDARFPSNEDYHFWLRATAAGFRILRNPKPLGFYRRRPNSVSANDRRMLHGITAVLRDIATHHDLSTEAQHAIDRQLRRFEGEIAKLDVRGFLDRRRPDGAARARCRSGRARVDEWGSVRSRTSRAGGRSLWCGSTTSGGR